MSDRIVKSYRVLIGMEIHVQLATRSKMFTAAPNGAANFGAEPNTLVDEQVLGLPGSLPVMNKRAVEFSIMTGLALGCEITRHTKWDRKSYYYPDLPKNYQISQYDLPICSNGMFAGVRIRRAHLEEDAGKLLHEAPGGHPIDYTIVDLNRAGTPLLEIVTEPDLTSAEQVRAFAQELQRVVQFLGVSEAQMQMGHMRFEPNINVHITDQDGTVHNTAITEIKNLNSFNVLERATAYEIQRQLNDWVETGSLGRKSTMGWDETTGRTFLQREKEEAHDYRYFPDPDLMPVEVSDAWIAELKAQIGELPAARRKRYVESFGLPPVDAAILATDRATGDFYEQAVESGGDAIRVANLLINVVAQLANKQSRPMHKIGIEASDIASVARLIDEHRLSASNALPLFEFLTQRASAGPATSVATSPAQIEALAQSLGLLQTSDTSAIDAAIDALLGQNPKPLQDYRAGKQAAMGALVGMLMRGAKGLNPKMVQDRLREKLSGSDREPRP